jgi:acetyl esterase/lipase
MQSLSRRTCLKGAFGASVCSFTDSLRAQNVDPAVSEVARELLPYTKGVSRGFWSPTPLTQAALVELRRTVAANAPAPLASPAYKQMVVPGRGGRPDVALYVVNAKPGRDRGGILHMHGGGYIFGRAVSDLSNLQAMASVLDCTIVSVDYRLAPETGWQGSLDDNYAALRWVSDNATDLGIDASRIALLGESAGGGHAARLATVARDRGEMAPCFQGLVYPMLDDRTGSSRKVRAGVGGLVWTEAMNVFGWAALLGQKPGTANIPAGAVPARNLALSGLPPAWIGVGSVDLFVAEDIDYAARLNAAGVPAALMVVPGAFHGFDSIASDTRMAADFTASKMAAIRQAITA